ncbi:MAG: hypothetical protein JWM11_7954 [Planctomycetaceae bacterium]|nr:hypothetical protein [Planctomycetaceae bacterium]
MAWELHIQQPDSDGSCEGEGVPLGSLKDVHDLMSSYFPETDWKNASSGNCSCQNGLIEIELCGDPVDFVLIKIHNADPSLQLIALAQANKWIVVNEATGGLLHEEENFDGKLISRVQREAASNQLAIRSKGAKSKPKMPRVKSRVSLLDVKPAWILNELRLVSLRDDEVTMDLFDEYHSVISNDRNLFSMKGHPLWSPDEVVLPNGQRLAAIQMSKLYPETSLFFYEYWKQSSRRTADLIDGIIQFDDGTKIDAKDCLWVERASGRTRRE